MFDINARMEQWSTAGRAQHTEEIAKSIKTAPEPAPTEPFSRSAEIKTRAKPFIKAKCANFDINGRVDAWNQSYKAKDSVVFEKLSSSDPFKKADDGPSEVVQMLMNESPEIVMDMIEMCIEKLESASGETAEEDKTPEEKPEEKEAPKEEKAEDTKEADDAKEESDEKDDDKEDSSE